MLTTLTGRFSVAISWSFFSTSHGKGVVDAIGGTLKSHARRLVLSRKSTISNAGDFIAASNDMKILLFPYTQADVDLVKIQFPQEWLDTTVKLK